MKQDYEKHNEAIRYGWVILYIMSEDIQEKNIKKTVLLINTVLSSRPQTIQKAMLNTSLPIRTSYQETIRRLLDE